MSLTFSGYYTGSQIIPDEKLPYEPGKRLTFNVQEESAAPTLEEKKKMLRSFMNRGPRLFDMDAQEYVRELRDNDRL